MTDREATAAEWERFFFFIMGRGGDGDEDLASRMFIVTTNEPPRFKLMVREPEPEEKPE